MGTREIYKDKYDFINFNFLDRFHIYALYENKRKELFDYLYENYPIFPYKRGKHIKNVIRKILKDKNIIVKKNLGDNNYIWIQICLKEGIVAFKNMKSYELKSCINSGVAPLGRWHREESYPVNSMTPEEAKAETS